MGVQPAAADYGLQAHDRLLLSLAQQLRQPLLQISRQAELGQMLKAEEAQADLANILVSADTALKLVDNYVLSLQATARGEDLVREPVSVAAVLHDAAHELAPAARQYGIELQIDAETRMEPVSIHRLSLQAAFVSLGHALIEALASAGTYQTPLRFSAHRCRYGVVAGLYCGHEEITVNAFRRSQQLHGTSRQPLINFANSGAGIFVADALLKVMSTKLKVSRHQSNYGLAAILPPINQLQLI